jgi:putative addiction module component (TIGR02574 family)
MSGGTIMSCAEILEQALALPEGDRANLVQSLIHSLPSAPGVYSTPRELGAELQQRIEETKSGAAPTFDAAETMRRAREAVKSVRQ